jgi:uracil-DNA glycosylase
MLSLCQFGKHLCLTALSGSPLSPAMPDAATMFTARDAASLMAWWQDAGVDTLVDEVPVPWLERGKPVKAASVAKLDAAPAATLPDTLEAYLDWWMTTNAIPDAGPSARRMAPAGDGSCGIMALIDLPDREDIAEGRLISGEAGQMFDRMLVAASKETSEATTISRDTIRLAALAPGPVPSGRIARDHEKQLGEIAAHHIALVRPKRLWIMGEAASRAILGMELAEARGRKHNFNYSGGTVESVASLHPRLLVKSATLKRRVWEEMQMLIEGL